MDKPQKGEKKSGLGKPLNRYDYLALAGLILVAVVVVALRLNLQIHRGPGVDTYAFLDNALNMAGLSDYFEINRPPFLSFLVSIPFRFGLVSELVIYLIDDLFFIIGVVGLYFLARTRLSTLPSLTAGLIFISFPDVITNLSFGITDIIAISLSIWMLYFTVMGAERNPRYYIAVPPLFLITFLTRYTAAVMIFPITFYIFLRGNVLRDIRQIGEGISVALIIFVSDIAYYYAKARSDMFIQFTAPYAIATTVVPEQSVTSGATQPRLWFVTEFKTFLSPSVISYVILALILASAIFFFFQLLNRSKDNRRGRATAGLIIFLVMSSFLALSDINFVLVNFVLLGVMLFIMPSLFDVDKDTAFLFLIFFWFLAFFTYHSHQTVKVPRYFITMAPAVALFIAFGFQSSLDFLQRLNLKKGLTVIATALMMAGVLLVSGLGATASYRKIEGESWTISGLKEANEWVHDNTKPDDIVFADYFVATAWYARRPIKAMPTFADKRAFNHELEKQHADYFVSIWHTEDMPSYYVYKQIGWVSIYKRKAKPLPNEPRIFMIGKDLDHYIEDVLDFKYYVIRRKTPFPDDLNRSVATTYVDDYSLDTLKDYDTLLLYNFRWQSIGNAETLLKQYLDQGGTIIIDTSGNSGSPINDLTNGTFLGVSIIKDELPQRPKITITKDYGVSRGVDTNKFAVFRDETGGTWTGDSYMKGPSSGGGDIQKLAGADSKTLIGLQQYGKGRIIWIGYNFVFHAYYYQTRNEHLKDRPEERLIQNVFAFATK